MSNEKRKHPRTSRPLEAKWQAASGGSDCRIADISWGGCFIQTPGVPAIGERTVVSTAIGGREVTLTGSVVALELAIGFSIEFDPLTKEQIDVLKELLGAPPASAG